jgi:hypothetical protein
MINKILLQSILNKYHLGVNQSVKWVIKNNNLEIDFMSPTKDIIGKISCSDFKLEDSEIAIYDTKKLSNLLSICQGELLLELEKSHKIYTKLYISDASFNLTYALSDPLLMNKIATVNIPEWVIEINLESEDITNLIKAKSALGETDNMLFTTTQNLDGEDICEFVFGDEAGHNNKITYQISGNIKETNMKIPFNSEMFKSILQVNKDMEEGKMFVSSMGLMKLEFKTDIVSSEYFMVRKAETSF